MKQIILLFFFFSFANLYGQQTIGFENFGLPIDSFLNGSDGNGGFTSGNAFFPNDYNAGYDAWSGWSISTETDTITPGFMNQYSASTGTGYNSLTYGVSFAFSPSIVKLENDLQGGTVDGFFITNNTYAYRSMQNGDQFAKAFGGATGDDPDFFQLSIKKYYQGQLSTDSVNFFLADYRFSDNSLDYIVTEWTFLDLTSLGAVDSLLFTLTSSDMGMFGMNTPAYFCMDDLTVTPAVATRDVNLDLKLTVFPNPTTDVLYLDWEENAKGTLTVHTINGSVLYQDVIVQGKKEIDTSMWTAGLYLIKITSDEGTITKRIVKP